MPKPKYRILIETQADGKCWYYVQRRYWFFFWEYLNDTFEGWRIKYSFVSGYKIGWPTLEEAEEYLEDYKKAIEDASMKKIINRSYTYK